MGIYSLKSPAHPNIFYTKEHVYYAMGCLGLDFQCGGLKLGKLMTPNN